MATTTLSPKQCEALFDILTHEDTYSQIQYLRFPGSLASSGPPFSKQGTPSTTPSLQRLMSKNVVCAVGLRDVPAEYWDVQTKGIIDALQDANLSESSDKGSTGTRKTLATLQGALLEYPVRGTFGGIKKREITNRQYDLGKAADLERGWADFCNEAVWGTSLDEMVAKSRTTDRIEDHEPLVQAMSEYLTVSIATILHYTLVVAPQGQYLLGLATNVIKMIPWAIVKQTLKIGNAASMTNAMMKVLLAKVSVGSFTNNLGFTSGKDEGMNLNQRILAMTFGGDIKEFESKAKQIEKSKTLTKVQLQCLKDYTELPRGQQEKIRHQSESFCISIADSILAAASLPGLPTPAANTSALNYLSYQLSIRDRREIVRITCRSNPDHLTTMIRTHTDVYDQVIRRAHKASDLSYFCGLLEAFLKDLVKVAKIGVPKRGDKVVVIPTVADFLQLLRLHRQSLTSFLHQLAKGDEELIPWFLEVGKESVKQFRDDTGPETLGAGRMTEALNRLFFSASSEDMQKKMLPVLDQYAQYMEELDASQTQRLQSTLDAANRKTSNPVLEEVLEKRKKEKGKEKSSDKEDPEDVTPDQLVSAVREMSMGTSTAIASRVEMGPGGYLLKWRDLLDRQQLSKKELNDVSPLQNHGGPVRPDTSVVEKALCKEFREILGVVGKDW